MYKSIVAGAFALPVLLGSPAFAAEDVIVSVADGGVVCEWDTTIRPLGALISEEFERLVASEREYTASAGGWTPDQLYNELGHDYVVPDPTDFHPRPVADLGVEADTREEGLRIHPVLGYRKWHSGYDFGGSTGDPVWALTGGVVVQAGYRSSYGNLLVVDHGNGFTTLYAHLSHLDVGVGDVVASGQTLGAVGSTGRVTGAHLHFETRLGGVPVNPRWLVNDLAVPSEVAPYSSLDLIPSEGGASIYRLYTAVFLRCPDPDGFAHWNNELLSGTPLTAMADYFAASPEFDVRYGDVADAEYVELVYENVMGRAPDVEGLQYWTGLLNSGLVRGDVLLHFSDSEEYITRAGFD